MNNRFVPEFDSDDTDALSEYWDAVARRDPHPSTDGLDPETLALIRRVSRASRTDAPRTGRDRALNAAMRELAGNATRSNGHERRLDMTKTSLMPLHPGLTHANGHSNDRKVRTTSSSAPNMRHHRLGTVSLLAAVAVLVTALSGGFATLRDGLSDSDEGRFFAIPAEQVSSDATPSAVTPLRTLVIPAEFLPAGEISVDTWIYTQEAGITEEFADLPMRVSIEFVFTGTYGVTSDGPRLIWRGNTDAPPEEIAAGAEAVVGPGDSIAYLDDSPQTTRVIGEDFVVAFGISFLSSSVATGATGDATVVLQRVTLEQGETLPAGEMHVERFVETGILTFDLYRTGESTPRANQTYENTTVPYAPSPSGVTIVMRNDGDEPVVFIEAVVTLPASDTAPATGTPTD